MFDEQPFLSTFQFAPRWKGVKNKQGYEKRGRRGRGCPFEGRKRREEASRYRRRKERKERRGKRAKFVRLKMHNSLLFTARSIDQSLIHFLLCPIVPENYVAQIQLRINASFLSPIVSTFSTIFLRHVWIRRVALLLRIHWPFDKPFVPPFSSEITALFPFLNGFCTTGSFEIVETGNCFSFQVQCSVNYVLWFLGRIEFNYDFEYRPKNLPM